MKKIAFLLLIGALMAACTPMSTTGEKSARSVTDSGMSDNYQEYFMDNPSNREGR